MLLKEKSKQGGSLVKNEKNILCKTNHPSGDNEVQCIPPTETHFDEGTNLNKDFILFSPEQFSGEGIVSIESLPQRSYLEGQRFESHRSRSWSRGEKLEKALHRSSERLKRSTRRAGSVRKWTKNC